MELSNTFSVHSILRKKKAEHLEISIVMLAKSIVLA